MQVDWRVSVKPPKLGRGLAGSMPGLGSLLTSDDEMDACSTAAHAALAAARLAGYRASTSGRALKQPCVIELCNTLSRAHVSLLLASLSDLSCGFCVQIAALRCVPPQIPHKNMNMRLVDDKSDFIYLHMYLQRSRRSRCSLCRSMWVQRSSVMSLSPAHQQQLLAQWWMQPPLSLTSIPGWWKCLPCRCSPVVPRSAACAAPEGVLEARWNLLLAKG